MTDLLLGGGYAAIGVRDPGFIVVSLIVIFVAIGIHEFAHAKFADMAGDPTPRMYGRVTLNLFNHFDPMGSIMILVTTFAGFGIGWGRPVPMNPSRMRNPKWDHFWAVLAGPLSNLVQAGVYAIFLRLSMIAGVQLPEVVLILLLMGVLINLSLCFFNLIPLGPLDGMWLAGTFMNDRTRHAWTTFNLTTGVFLFLAIVIGGQLAGFSLIGQVIAPPMRVLFQFLTGIPAPI